MLWMGVVLAHVQIKCNDALGAMNFVYASVFADGFSTGLPRWLISAWASYGCHGLRIYRHSHAGNLLKTGFRFYLWSLGRINCIDDSVESRGFSCWFGRYFIELTTAGSVVPWWPAKTFLCLLLATAHWDHERYLPRRHLLKENSMCVRFLSSFTKHLILRGKQYETFKLPPLFTQ